MLQQKFNAQPWKGFAVKVKELIGKKWDSISCDGDIWEEKDKAWGLKFQILMKLFAGGRNIFTLGDKGIVALTPDGVKNSTYTWEN